MNIINYFIFVINNNLKKNIMPTEIWKPISSKMYFYSDMVNTDYEVSNMGRIRNGKTGKMIHPFPTQNGKKLRWTMHKSWDDYPVTLQFLVDHTVYETFIGDCYDKRVHHRDGNLMNNEVSNLYI